MQKRHSIKLYILHDKLLDKLSIEGSQLGMVVHTFNPSTLEAKQEDDSSRPA
jgi:hypothetical protein